MPQPKKAEGEETGCEEPGECKRLQQQPAAKRRNLGRKARRRRKKLQEIEAAAASTSTTTTTSSYEILPSDRDRVWPAVQELCQLTTKDKQALVQQLGYLPGNAIRVVARWRDAALDKAPQDDDKFMMAPLVLELYPLVLRDESDGTKSKRKRARSSDVDDNSSTTMTMVCEPFPTHLWCTHPQVRALISQLELQQWGKILEERLEKDAEVMSSMKLAHVQYGKERCDMITPRDWTYIQSRRWESAFDANTRGVAGIRNPASVKCLHAHAAHYWSGCQDNVVGKWVADEVKKLVKCVENS